MTLPPPLIASLKGLPGFDADAFTAVHHSGHQVSSVRFNPVRWRAATGSMPQDAETLSTITGLPVADPVPWSANGYYLTHRPVYTTDPLLHAGAYYVQEASSMFLEQAVQQCCGHDPLYVLDLCAAPGGKSTLLQSILHKDSLLVSNEVIKTRVNSLAENITKWGAANVVITNNDARHFQRLGAFFDLVVVDAPCSGSGLFRRDPQAIAQWSEDAVLLCQQRQQRILADILPVLKPGGILIYATCSYSPREDEDIADWLVAEQGMESLLLTLPPGAGITASAGNHSHGYRFFPGVTRGEGFFIACFRKTAGDSGVPATIRPQKTAGFTPAELQRLQACTNRDDDFGFIRQKDEILAVPPVVQEALPLLQSVLYLRKAGIKMGKLINGALIPDHELALGFSRPGNVPELVLDKATAVQYLRRADFTLPPAEKGWNLVTTSGFALGWIKVMPNRFNNYYPPEWRILMKA